jgi:hypothetical protein
LVFKNFNKKSIANHPDKKLVKNPIRMLTIPTSLISPNEVKSLYKPAPTTIGIESKKENLAASSRDKPKNIPEEIVEPEREMPGNKAKV